MLMARVPLWLAVVALSSAPAFAADVQQAEKNIQEQFKASAPDVRVTSVKPSPLSGWYEVTLGAKLVYVSEDGRYVFAGELMDLKEQRNLTDGPSMAARGAALKAVDGKAIEFAPAGKTEHVLYVFTDTDCAYCRKMHTEVNELNAAGIAVRYLAFPRAGIESRTYDTMVSVWCSPDRKQALTDAKAGKDLPKLTCDNPVRETFELGKSMGVRGTPAVMLENGVEIGGYVPAQKIIEHFKGGAS